MCFVKGKNKMLPLQILAQGAQHGTGCGRVTGRGEQKGDAKAPCHHLPRHFDGRRDVASPMEKARAARTAP